MLTLQVTNKETIISIPTTDEQEEGHKRTLSDIEYDVAKDEAKKCSILKKRILQLTTDIGRRHELY